MKLEQFLKDNSIEVHPQKNDKTKMVLTKNGITQPSNKRDTKDLCLDLMIKYTESVNGSLRKFTGKDAADVAFKEIVDSLSAEYHHRVEAAKAAKAERERSINRAWDDEYGKYVAPVSPGNFWLLRSRDGGSDNILFDPKVGDFSDIHIDNYLETWKAHCRLQGAKPITEFAREARFTSFHSPDPESKKIEFILDAFGGYYKINTYQKPKWMTDYAHLKDEAKVPDLIDRFHRHFFMKNEATIERVRDWYANSLFGKDPVMLCYVSPVEGLGKTLDLDITGALHSKGRYFKPPSDVLGTFNHSLYGKSLVLFDEINAVGVAKESLRKLIGNETTTRKMNSDQGMKLDQPMSWAATTNVPSHLGIEGRGRRFFVPNITSIKLSDAFTKQEMDKLGDYSRAFNENSKSSESDREEMAKYGWFLFDRFVNGVESSPAILEDINPINFWECQLACMKPWQQAVMELFLYEVELNEDGTCGIYNLEDLRESLPIRDRKFLPNYSDLKSFVTGHDWRGSKLCELDETKILRESIIKPIIHKDFQFDLSPFDNQEAEEELL